GNWGGSGGLGECGIEGGGVAGGNGEVVRFKTAEIVGLNWVGDVASICRHTYDPGVAVAGID
ncbi:MAG TPA: hypothetical protein VGN88_02585, partial [Phycisphaerae bacterium]